MKMKVGLVCCVLALLFSVIAAKGDLRIIGGTDAAAGQFPFLVAIHIQTADSRYFCGGAVMNNQWVLTSGHCVNNGILFTIQLGSTTLSASDSNRVIAATSEYVIHPEFDPEKIQNDLGLIKMRMNVTYTDYIQRLALLPATLQDDTLVTSLGWGQTSDFDPELTEHLQYVQTTVLPNAECRLVYGNQITENMVCVEGNYNEGICTGDNGAPLVEYFGGTYWLVGIASFISGNGCESTDPSGYTRTAPYFVWIRSVINNEI